MTNLLIKNDNLDINTIFVSGNFTLSKFKAGKGLNEKIVNREFPLLNKTKHREESYLMITLI